MAAAPTWSNSRPAQDLAVTAKLLQCRTTLRVLHGAHYADRVAPVVAAMRRAMAHSGLQPLQILARCADATDVDVLWLAAAAVEIIDSEVCARSGARHEHHDGTPREVTDTPKARARS